MPEEKKDYTPYAEGFYKAVIERTSTGESSKGTPFIAFAVKLTELTKANDGRKHEDKLPARRSALLYLTDATKDSVTKILRHLGWQRGMHLEQFNEDHPQRYDCAGMELDIQIKHELYEGKKREKLGIWAPYGSNSFMDNLKPANTSKLKGWDAVFGSALGGAPPAKKSESTKPKPKDDDIPFGIPAGEGDDQADSGDENW